MLFGLGAFHIAMTVQPEDALLMPGQLNFFRGALGIGEMTTGMILAVDGGRAARRWMRSDDRPPRRGFGLIVGGFAASIAGVVIMGSSAKIRHVYPAPFAIGTMTLLGGVAAFVGAGFQQARFYRWQRARPWLSLTPGGATLTVSGRF